MIILLYSFCILCVILMRESRMAGYAPSYRAPLYPWLQIVGLAVNSLLLVELGTLPLLIMGVILGLGFAGYFFYAKHRVSRESALVRVAKRIAAWTFPDHNLDEELTAIVHERDLYCKLPKKPKPVELDRFDRLITHCPILDVPGAVSMEGLFSRVSESLAPRLRMSAEEITRLLHEREETSSTVVAPGLAIPHLVADGESFFDIMLVRCREGATFEDDQPQVNAVFVLIGTPDERNFHLRALMAVAEIAQDPDFSEKWRRAQDAEDLRRLILDAERRRDTPVHET